MFCNPKTKIWWGRARITHTSILFVKLFCLRFSIYWYLYYLDNDYKLKNIKFRIRTWTIILIVDCSDVVSLVTQQIGYPATMKYIWHHCSKTFIKECLAFDIFFIFYFQFFISQLSEDNSSRINSLNIKQKRKVKIKKRIFSV